MADGRSHSSKTKLLEKLRMMKSGLEDPERAPDLKTKFLPKTSQILTLLETAFIEQKKAEAEYHVKTGELHEIMLKAEELLTALDDELYVVYGRKNPALYKYGLRPHKKTGPKGPRKKAKTAANSENENN
ncbi:MAG TPA: hypothetical protein ENN84_10515 [Candidatus Marinimicrobia bacterium]|nr:hypothetical protein [Candidatus Neomarinimicrobiota bacterium]